MYTHTYTHTETFKNIVTLVNGNLIELSECGPRVSGPLVDIGGVIFGSPFFLSMPDVLENRVVKPHGRHVLFQQE